MQGQLRIQKPAIDEGNHFLVAIATLKARQGILKKHVGVVNLEALILGKAGIVLPQRFQ